MNLEPFSSLSGPVVRPSAPALLRWSAVAGVATALFVGATAPAAVVALLTELPVPAGPVGPDVWLHLLGYAGLGAVLAAAIRPSGFRHGFAFAFGTVAGYGILAELLHAVLSYRTFSGLDLAANVLGALLGVGTVWVFLRLISTRARDDRFPELA